MVREKRRGGVSNEYPNIDPLCVIPPKLKRETIIFDWVLHKVDELKDCLEVSYEGFEKQFRAFIVAIEASQPSLARSTSNRKVMEKIEFYKLRC